MSALSATKHFLAILLLPVTMGLLIPALILLDTRSMNPGWSLPAPLNMLPLLVGSLLMLSGVLLVVYTIALFATRGWGTLAPWAPPERLVVHGVYRHVRNPMISGMLCWLLGGACLSGSFPLLQWSLIFLAVNALYIPLVEEPRLERRFGDAYSLYKQNVPRWIPRRRAWKNPAAGE